ncbi:MAG: zincin-like metallopeptidase domain-containing protein, partial [Cognatishimia sp.]
MLCRCRHNAHWSGGEKRLDRIKKFNDRTAYAFEELVAEIGA